MFGISITKDNEDALIEAATAAGWRQSATGTFSVVLVRGTQALKIFDDPAYLKFLTHIVSPENPTFPIVLEGPFVGAGLSVVILERLKALSVKDFPLSDDIMTVFEMADNRGRLEYHCMYVLALEEKIGSQGIDAIDLIIGLADAFDLSIDIRPPNLMIRPATEQLVFSDPLAIFH